MLGNNIKRNKKNIRPLKFLLFSLIRPTNDQEYKDNNKRDIVILFDLIGNRLKPIN